jgi:site-specific recombinase XerD
MTALAPLPSIETRLIALVCDAVSSPASKRAYKACLGTFLGFCKAQGHALNREAVQAYRSHLEALGKRGATINQHLAAIKAFAKEAKFAGAITAEEFEGIREVKSIPIRGQHCGVWLDKDQMLELLAAPDQATLIGRRDFVLLSILLGAGLRRTEAVGLACDQIQTRDGVLCIVNCLGKGKRLRSVPLPRFCWQAVRQWIVEIGGSGPLLRSINRFGEINGSLDDDSVRYIVVGYAKRLGFEGLAPHSCRRSYAHACLKGGADLNEIRLALGHSSLSTTTRYMGDGLNLKDSIAEKLGL